MLLKLFGQSFLGSLSYAVTQWLIISSIGRFLSIEDTGLYATSLGIVVTVNMFFNFGIRQITYSTESSKVLYLAQYVLLLQIIGLFSSVLLCWFFYPELTFLVICLYLHKVIETLTEYRYGIYQRNDEHYKIATSRIIRSITYTTSFILTVYLTKDLILSSLVMFTFNLVTFHIVDRVTFYNKEKIDFTDFKKIYLHLGAPLAVTAALLSLRTTAPRFFVENTMTYADVGLLVSYLYLVNAGGMIIQSWSQVISPKISRAYNNRCEKDVFDIFFKGAGFVLVYCFSFNIGFVLLGEHLIKFIYGNDIYFSTSLSFSIIVFMYASYCSSYVGYCVSGVREFKIQPKIFAILLAITLILLYFLSDFKSLNLIIYSLAVTSFLQFFMLLYVFVRRVKFIKLKNDFS